MNIEWQTLDQWCVISPVFAQCMSMILVYTSSFSHIATNSYYITINNDIALSPIPIFIIIFLTSHVNFFCFLLFIAFILFHVFVQGTSWKWDGSLQHVIFIIFIELSCRAWTWLKSFFCMDLYWVGQRFSTAAAQQVDSGIRTRGPTAAVCSLDVLPFLAPVTWWVCGRECEQDWQQLAFITVQTH